MKQLATVFACALSISVFGLIANPTANSRSTLTANQSSGFSSKETAQKSIKDFLPRADRSVQSPDSVSPYQIKRYVDEHKKGEYISLEGYWNKLGIEIEEWKKYGSCNAGIFELDLDRQPGHELMVRLYDDSGWSMGGTRYLIFKPSMINRQTEWKLLGYIDLTDQRYAVPSHRVINSGEYRWLVLTVLTGRGSGFGRHHDQWYEVTESGLREVLSYPSRKFLAWVNPRPVLETKAGLVKVSTVDNRAGLVIEFRASYYYGYSRSEERAKIWGKKQRAIFSRASESKGFVFDEGNSELSEEELEAIYNDDTRPTNSEILKYNFGDLKKIAIRGDERQKEWLRSYLNECKNSSEREELLKALSACLQTKFDKQ